VRGAKVIALVVAALVGAAGCSGGSSETGRDLGVIGSFERTAQLRRAAPLASAPRELRAAAPAVPVDPLDAASQLFDFAESSYAVYFPSRQTDRVSNLVIYRYYPETAVYLAAISGGVYVLGGPFGNQVRYVGELIDFITPRPTMPVPNAGDAQTIVAGRTVTLDGSRSSDPNGDRLTYQWSMVSRPSGSSAALTGSASISVRPQFVADRVGSYVFSLVVRDGKWTSVPASVTVTAVANSAPTAVAGPAQTVAVGSLVTLDGSASSDPDGDALTYFWSLISVPLGSTARLSSTTGVRPTFSADLVGTYVARLVVGDGVNTSTAATVNTSVVPLAPTFLSIPQNSSRSFSALLGTGFYMDNTRLGGKDARISVYFAPAADALFSVSADGSATNLNLNLRIETQTYSAPNQPSTQITFDAFVRDYRLALPAGAAFYLGTTTARPASSVRIFDPLQLGLRYQAPLLHFERILYEGPSFFGLAEAVHPISAGSTTPALPAAGTPTFKVGKMVGYQMPLAWGGWVPFDADVTLTEVNFPARRVEMRVSNVRIGADVFGSASAGTVDPAITIARTLTASTGTNAVFAQTVTSGSDWGFVAIRGRFYGNAAEEFGGVFIAARESGGGPQLVGVFAAKQ
jgi:hypothetical protein